MSYELKEPTTISKLARVLDVSNSAVHQWGAQGLIKIDKTTSPYTVPPQVITVRERKRKSGTVCPHCLKQVCKKDLIKM